MKWSCNIIRDLIPLYIDDVCSEESKKIIEEHLEECEECKAFLSSMNEENNIIKHISDNSEETQKISSFKAVKKRMQRKQIISGIVAVLIAVSIFATTVSILKNIHRTVEYEDNISVSMVDGSLIGRLYGSYYTNIKIKNVEITNDGKISNYTFYCISNTVWDDISLKEYMMTEYVIVPKDKNADRIDCVYYYTGDFSGLENMSETELQTVIQNSELLWEK